jgi:hypothetical protein
LDHGKIKVWCPTHRLHALSRVGGVIRQRFAVGKFAKSAMWGERVLCGNRRCEKDHPGGESTVFTSIDARSDHQRCGVLVVASG